MNKDIKIFTTENSDKKYKSLGIVQGIQVKSMNIFTNLMTDLTNIFGTSKNDWSKVKELFDETRREAIDEMKSGAIKLNATDIIGVRIDVSELSRGRGPGMLVVTAYGTAINKTPDGENLQEVKLGGKRKKQITKNRKINKRIYRKTNEKIKKHNKCK